VKSTDLYPHVRVQRHGWGRTDGALLVETVRSTGPHQATMIVSCLCVLLGGSGESESARGVSPACSWGRRRELKRVA
jgi:hypothetical protein